MNLNTQGPRYTAYALGELDERERAEIEREARDNPAVQKMIASIRDLADDLQAALADEPAPGLEGFRREAILRAARRRRAARLFLLPVWSLTSIGTAIAALLVGVFGYQHYMRQMTAREERLLAMDMTRTWDSDAPVAEMELEMLEDHPPVASLPAEHMHMPAIPPLDLADFDTPSAPAPARLESVHHFSSMDLAAARSPLVMRGLYESRSSGGRQAALGRASRSQNVAAEARLLPSVACLSPSLDDFPERRDSGFIRVADHPLSTFSIDVDTASYAVTRSFLDRGIFPLADAVRIEELINYFTYDYASPAGEDPFAVHLEAAPAPWNPENLLARIALKGRELYEEDRPPLRLVFLIDVSGSMHPPNRLPLVVRSLQALTARLDERDRVAIVVYAGASGLVLPSTSGSEKTAILEALDGLRAAGSTAGSRGIQMAYEIALGHYDPEAANRVILCTDGDFNVGITQRGDLERFIEEKAKTGVFLTVLGFGMGNFKDSTLEILSNKGNGNYAYIDSFSEARKVLVDQMLGTLVTIAKDVKVQVEFNPARVAGYRLIGYENRLLRKEDFNDDRIDAGDLGAGHTVTAFYELIPAGKPVRDIPGTDELKYQTPPPPTEIVTHQDEILTVKLRYKLPDGETSSRIEAVLGFERPAPEHPTEDFRFAAAVAAFGQRLRQSEYIRDFSYDDILALAEGSMGRDPFGYRAAFLEIVRNARAIVPPSR